MADKKSNREKLNEITASIERGIKELFQSDKYAAYLRTMSRFHSYSARNTILIHMQRPDATAVAGFNAWKNKFQRHVKKGEKGITILAPTPFKKKIEEKKLDPVTMAPMLDQNGRIIMEEKEVEIPMFRPVKVFDVAQTEGKPLPELSSPLTGDVQNYEVFMEALRRTSPVPISFQSLPEDTDGMFYHESQSIVLREGMSQVQTVCAAVHEITHSLLHNQERDRLIAVAGTEGKKAVKKDRNTEEVEAESVSYAVCQYYGIQTGENSFGYIASWSKDRSLPELKASLDTISRTASRLISDIDRNFKEICKERGIDLTQPEEAEADTLEQLAADLYDFMEQLHQEGVLKHPFTQDPREQSIADLVTEMQKGYFEGVRDPLNYLVEHTDLLPSDLTKAKAMLAKLDDLAQSVPLNEYVYKMEANPRTVGATDRHFIQAYERTAEGTLKPDRVLFFGTADKCTGLIKKLQSGELRPDDFFQTSTARISHYATKDGAELDAFMGPDDKVYMGRRDHYDNRGHYLNDDKSLLYLSDNTVMFDFVSGGCYSDTQAELLAQGCFTMEDYAEFDALRVGVLAQFEQTEPLLFAGEPFSFIQPDAAELEQPAPEPLSQANEALYLVDGTAYLYIQLNDSSYDYTFYDKGTLRQLDGGQMAILDIGGSSQADFRNAADLIILGERNLNGTSVEPVPLDMLDTLQNAEEQAVQAAVTALQDQRESRLDKLREHFAQENDALMDTTLDEYPMPDPAFPADELEQNYGYMDGDLLPLSRDRAAELLDRDLTVYMVHIGENPSMVFDTEEIAEQPEGVIFAVPREEWEASPDFHQLITDRLNHQEERERAFLDHGGDCFAIYQIKDEDPDRLHFMSMDWLNAKGLTVDRANYELAYTGEMECGLGSSALEKLWEKFNTNHPADYHRPSMSVSDILAVKQDGVVSFHYCDSIGFAKVPDFIKPENYLKSAEMSVEDDLGMIDGIINNGTKEPTVAELEQQARSGQPISLMDLAAATHRESQEKKGSVVEKLKNQPKQERKRAAPKRGVERER